MILDFETVCAITCGAADIKLDEDGIRFYRLNSRQMAYYKEKNTDYYNKAKTTSGIKLSFRTNSRALHLDMTLQKVMGRSYGAVEVFANGKKLGSLNNFSDKDLTGNYAERAYPSLRQEQTFQLGEGEKTVHICLPRLIGVVVHAIELDDGSEITAVKPSKKVLVFGDSITQGFDCLWPTSHYVEHLCKALDAEEFNKAIGGERHAPNLVAYVEDFVPDYIVVAYGTNDWRCEKVEDFISMCREFYENLAKYYPGVPVIAITPVWRVDIDAVRPLIHFGPIHEIEEYIRQIAAPYANVTVIRGYEFIPEQKEMFGDLRLHPNDEGFTHYGINLVAALKDILI